MLQIEKFRSLFEDCRNLIGYIPSEVIADYFPQSNFDSKVDQFFSIRDKDLQSFIEMTYPFYGRQFIEPEFFQMMVKDMPELVVSVIAHGYGVLINANQGIANFSSKHNIMSRQTTLSCMSIILSYWYFWDDIGKNGKTKDETQKYGSSKDSEYAKSLFTLIGQPISILGEHYDLNGCLQYHYNRLWTSSRVLELMSPQQVGPLSFQSNYRKRTLINILCKRGAEPEFLSAEYSEGGWYNSNLTYSHDYIRYEQSRGFLKRELEESTIVDPELDAIIVQRISELKEESLIEDLFTNIEEREISNEDMVKESHRTNRPNYGLVLSLPEDNTSNQSKVSLCIMRSSEEIGKVILSHMEAAFLYYLGAEREAGESYWLHAPNEHRELLLKIWNSLSLPRAFEDELAMDSPKKDSSTWIWDFRNNNRKTLRNQIQRKLKYLREDALDFNLITSIKPKSPSRGGNYKLNNQITSFEITPPSR